MKDKNGLTEEAFLASYNADKYPKPSVTADIVIIAQSDQKNEVLLVKRGGHPFLGKWATPGGFANKNEPIELTARRELKEETGIEGVDLTLIGIYSKPGRDPRGWTISGAYCGIVKKDEVKPIAADDADDAKWFVINDDNSLSCDEFTLQLSDLAFDHEDIMTDVIKYIRRG